MLPGFSGTLLDADLRGSPAPPAFLGTATGAGAAADPAAFLVGGPEEEEDAHVGSAGAGGLGPAGEDTGPATVTTSSASDLLRQLESSYDFLLPPSEPLDMPSLLLGASSGGIGGGRGAGCTDASSAAAAGMEAAAAAAWDSTSPVAASPGTPPNDGGASMLPCWPSVAFPTIPEESELMPQAAAGGAAGGSVLVPPPHPHVSSLDAHLPGSVPAPLGPSPFNHVPTGAPHPLPVFVPVPEIQPAAAAAQPLLLAPPAPMLAPAGPVTAIAGGSTSQSEAASPAASSSTTSSSGQPSQAAPGSTGATSGGRSRGVPRPASMPNLHLSLTSDTSVGAVRKKVVLRAPATKPSKAKAMPRSRSHSDLKGSSHSAAAAVAAAPAAADPAYLPHSAFLTPVHLRKGKGGRQPAADPRLDPRIDPKKAARIMANRLSAAKSKLKQKSQAQKADKQRSQQPQDEEEAMDTEEAVAQQGQHNAQVQAVEQQLAAQHLRSPAAGL